MVRLALRTIATRAARRRGRRAAAPADVTPRPTPGLALGYVQANLVVLPKDWAFDFLLFCQRNPKPCPLLDVTEPGDPEPKSVAPGSRPPDRPARLSRVEERRAGRGTDRRHAATGATTSCRSSSAVRSRSRTRFWRPACRCGTSSRT